MKARAILGSAAPYIIRYSGMSRALALRYAGPGTIFMLHSIVDDAGSYPDDSLRCPVSVLERTLIWLERNDIEVVSLDEAIQRLSAPATRQFCVFSFDDGYADNLTRVLPLMERYRAPFTVYVTTGMVTGEIDAWWLGLAELIRTQDHVELPRLGRRFDCRGQLNKKRAFAAVIELVDLDHDALADVREAIAASGIDCSALIRAEGLTVEQLRRLAASPLVTIGAHSVRHIDLGRASVAEVKQEMTTSRRFLEGVIDREVAHFAYPFGDVSTCGVREACIAKSVGFRTAVTTRHGTLFPEHLEHRYALPREPIFGKDTLTSLHCKIGGTYRAFYSGFGDPVAQM